LSSGYFKYRNYFNLSLTRVGKDKRADKNSKNLGEKVCFNLTSLYHRDKQRTLTADNFFSSFELVSKLWSVNFRYVGTLRKNKAQIPACFQPNPEKATFSSLFGFNGEKTLVSYVPKPKKAVILISSEHHSNEVSDNESKKPEIILFYNRTKGSVDAFDQMTEKYTCRRKSNRWPFTIFMFMLDSAAINSVVLFGIKHPEMTSSRLRRRKLEELSCNLIRLCAIQRYNQSALKNHIGFNRNIMFSYHKLIDDDQINALVTSSRTTTSVALKRCSHKDCKGKGNKHKNKCHDCLLTYCKHHCEIIQTVVCSTCILD